MAGPKHTPGDAPLRFHVSSGLEVAACRRALPCECDSTFGTHATLEAAAEAAGQPPLTTTYMKGHEPQEVRRGVTGRKPALSEEQVALLPSLVKKGLRQTDIASQFGVSQPTINNYLKRLRESLEEDEVA